MAPATVLACCDEDRHTGDYQGIKTLIGKPITSTGPTLANTASTALGIPDSNLNQLTAAQLATGLTNPAALTGQVTKLIY